ncbi:MAG: pyridoxamine 5'-phosphate oxidase family protein [Acidimicrobiales bacterium]
MDDGVFARVAWDDVAARLAAAPRYWLHTTNRDGSPHPSPVWGVVHADDFYWFTSRSTRKARNLERDPRMSVHLESAHHVVIVHGDVVDLGDPRRQRAVLEALDAKYAAPGEEEYLPSHNDQYDVLFRVVPRGALLWDLDDFESSQRRWRDTDEAATAHD